MLVIQNLSAAYEEKQVLEEINLIVKPGEIVAVIGPNGAGKTTLIKAVSGSANISNGSIQIGSQDLTSVSDSERARMLAVVPQAKKLPGGFSVYQTVLLGRTAYLGWLGHPEKEDHNLVKMAIQQTRLGELVNKPVGQLSGGEQQRVLLARALAQNSPVLLLDEPTTHLDLHHQTVFLRMLKNLVRERSLTVLMVLHDLNLVGAYADKVVLLSEGKIQVSGRPEEVLTMPNLSQVYRVDVQVISHPKTGTPLVVPEHLASISITAGALPADL